MAYVKIDFDNQRISLPKDTVKLTARPFGLSAKGSYTYEWSGGGTFTPASGDLGRPNTGEIATNWHLSDHRVGGHKAYVKVMEQGADGSISAVADLDLLPEALIGPEEEPQAPLSVTLQRSTRPPKEDEILWIVIRNSTNSLSFNNYSRLMDLLFCGEGPVNQVESDIVVHAKTKRANDLRLPFPGVDPYRLLRVATEAFLQIYSGVKFDFSTTDLPTNPQLSHSLRRPLTINLAEEAARFGRGAPDGDDLQTLWNRYVGSNVIESPDGGGARGVLPYLALVRQKIPEVGRLLDGQGGGDGEYSAEILHRRLSHPFLLELIWSYWHEEGLLVQTMRRLTDRFQNRRTSQGRDPLANLEIDPLRPLNNLLWGYIQDEQHRLSVVRRAQEYRHQYGITLQGKAVMGLEAADHRSKFLESFHNLLYQCIQFYRQEDDTTVIADGFPVLNSIKETHYVLAQGAHNQFGDLPSTARQEMLMEQWLLARPEMREFLGGRIMVPYPELWMDRVDAMKTLQGWTDTSAVHFRDLGVFGEQIVLSVRYGAWSIVNDHDQAANWARYWRPEIQAYVHAYRSVTGVDLTADVTDEQQAVARYLAPSVHLRNRLAARVAR
jgi:hypothetical protein